jgi:hypothetical protein
MATAPSILTATAPYPLHLLGWKSFQDLCISIAEEVLRRPVQNFLPHNDAGRDGAFVGRWDGTDAYAGQSTIQCKFTSQPDNNLSLSLLTDELEKARILASKRLADDYIILTNHPVTGASELKIRAAFQAKGVGRCRLVALRRCAGSHSSRVLRRLPREGGTRSQPHRRHYR